MAHNEMISNQVITHEIMKALKVSGYDGFTARPRNYFKPETTLWWLVPSTEWPSYKYGKLVLYRTKDGYRVGLHIEKGISELAGQMLSSKGARKLCVKPDWAWNNFISDLSNGILRTSLMGFPSQQNCHLEYPFRHRMLQGNTIHTLKKLKDSKPTILLHLNMKMENLRYFKMNSKVKCASLVMSINSLI